VSRRQLSPAAAALAAIIALAACANHPTASPSAASKVNHVIVIYQENWSFDGLYGSFPGADGISNAGSAAIQIDKSGRPYETLPPALDTRQTPARPDSRIPANLPNRPWDLSTYVAPDQMTGDLAHRFYQEQMQIDGGKMDGFVANGDAGALTMSHYDAGSLPEGLLAKDYTLLDHFFASAFGPSSLNHQWLVCACTPTWPDAPANQVAQVDGSGNLVKDGVVTPDGYAVNTVYPTSAPTKTDPGTPHLPSSSLPTIGDRLSDRQVSWAWYAGGWNDAVAGHPAPNFQPQHQPFNYFGNYVEGVPGRSHLKDEQDFLAALQGQAGGLPAVSFIKAIGDDNEHPRYASVTRGQQHTADLVKAVQASRYWKDSVIVIAYDEFGGRWDHVAPPKIDRWGPGVRVPAILVSPFAKRGNIEHKFYETVSILKMIEDRWGLKPLGTRDAAAPDLMNALAI
jgi:acid phosphatase